MCYIVVGYDNQTGGKRYEFIRNGYRGVGVTRACVSEDLAREDSFQEKVDKLSGRVVSCLKESRGELAAKWNTLDRLFLESFFEAFEHAILAKNG